MIVEDRELTERAAKIETLLEDIDSLPDPVMRAKAADIVQGLLVLYGEGLARMVAIVGKRVDSASSEEILQGFSDDDLVAHLLLLHDLHPIDVETRVGRALEEVRPYLQSHGGNVEFLGVNEGVARLRLQGSCSGCPSSTMTLKLAIEEAIQKVAPDVERIEAEGVVESPPQPVNFLPASDLLKKKASVAKGWKVVGGLPHIADGLMTEVDVGDVPLLFIKLEGTLYAYRNSCPNCKGFLQDGRLKGPELTCKKCEHQFDVRRAGRSLDVPEEHLEPVPLLVQEDVVKVSLNGS